MSISYLPIAQNRGDLQNLFEVNNATIKALEKRLFPSDSALSGGIEGNERCASIIIIDFA